MATVKKTMSKKYQGGGLLKGIIKSGIKKAEKTAVKDITEAEMKQAFKQQERNRLKSMFKEIDAKEAASKTTPKAKAGKQMIKRADGSYSQRGLWDNIRANKGSGKKPTAAMLKQEKKIKAKTKK